MEKEAAATSNPKEAPTCQECGRNPSKYRCPGCHLRSCSLPCVKAHKKRTSCTGKRDRTQFVPLSKFDDNLLISDYNLLEEAKRVAEASQRRRNGWSVGYPSFRLPHRLYLLRNAASKRRTRLLFLPSGMTRREKNQSRYDQRLVSNVLLNLLVYLLILALAIVFPLICYVSCYQSLGLMCTI
uniref:Box C/D snoRNA protein 1 n=1 Tax=Nelumbo nucifera TaxID=4432 RepID=A0A822YZ90_NELNU|nr:TPA_asm: hypothetical protein HUJ06_007210 [Nelumbo nucifera]